MVFCLRTFFCKVKFHDSRDYSMMFRDSTFKSVCFYETRFRICQQKIDATWLLVILKSTISHINYWDQVNSWKNLWKFWNGPLCRNKSDPFPLLIVAAYWQSSDTKPCAKKLSQILANNIDHGGRVIYLGIYVRYCLKR